MRVVLASIDLNEGCSTRVLRHAAGFARIFGAQLRVLHVASDASAVTRQQVVDFCRRVGPSEIDLADDAVAVRSGLVSDAIHREAMKHQARLIVMGSRGHSRLAVSMIGSTCQAVLRNPAAPILLVPPIDLDIVDISKDARLICGPVVAAVDLAEAAAAPLRLASELAMVAGQPWLLMTVASPSSDPRQAVAMLRARAHGNGPARLIVRRGNVAEEISRCALAEGAGLVVMGLRARGRGRPGAVAAAVLRTNRAFVLAVPAAEGVRDDDHSPFNRIGRIDCDQLPRVRSAAIRRQPGGHRLPKGG